MMAEPQVAGKKFDVILLLRHDADRQGTEPGEYPTIELVLLNNNLHTVSSSTVLIGGYEQHEMRVDALQRSKEWLREDGNKNILVLFDLILKKITNYDKW